MQGINSAIKKSLIVFTIGLFTACASLPSEDRIVRESEATLVRMLEKDPSLQDWFSNAYGYAIYPEVTKGGLWVGGGFGHGIVYEQGNVIGRTTVSQATIGAQIGVQSYSQIIFFADEIALRSFQRGNFEFSAQATAIAIAAGVARTTSYEAGVAVFIDARSGLMAEASIGGQKFSYEAFLPEETAL